MAAIIYVTSTHNYSGKSALCVGLIRQFRKDGFRVGYMKPVSTSPTAVGDRITDDDSVFMKTLFDIPDPLEAMAPIILNDQKVSAVLSEGEEDLTAILLSAFKTVSTGKDVVVLEGGASLREGCIINMSPAHVADLLHARELVVVPYIADLQLVDDLIAARVRLGDSLLGAVINCIPKHRHDFIEKMVRPFVERHGVTIYASLPRERMLLSVSVSELVEWLGGEVLSAPGSLNELVEHLVVGAMTVDSALKYFRQKPNQAVITGGDRPDIQLAALQTSTRCLILTGNIRPTPQVVSQAEEKGVPIILTRHDTMTAIGQIERFFGKTRFHQERKIRKFEEILSQQMNFNELYLSLGLRKNV